MKPVLPTEKHKQYRAELLALWNKFAGDLPADQMLALAAHSVGQMIAMQDQGRFTSKMVMNLVADNIEVGNKEVLDHLRWAEGGSA